MSDTPHGPLAGVRVLEFAGLGPAPFAGMLLSDMGADVVRIDRPGISYDRFAVETRGRRAIALDLKQPSDAETARRLADRAELLIEGFRPGVMERLGLGPEALLARNPALVYGRMTGWGQSGPLAARAGHDINYLALTGALHAIGPADRPVPPLNLVADFGGGALYLVVGLLAGLLHARSTGQGQVIDAAMSDGTIGLMGLLYGHFARGTWADARESNIIDGGSHFYGCYACADGGWLALGAIEPQFYAALVRLAGLTDPMFEPQMDQARWPEAKERLAAIIAQRTRDEWVELLGAADACATPILTMAEAPHHPHNLAREAFITVDGVIQPAPAPRFSATPGAVRHGPSRPVESAEDVLRAWHGSASGDSPDPRATGAWE